jgi:GT2 family glycosyltransferase
MATLVVYVDSGSTDSSVQIAKGLGVHVVELDMRIPFTAARARNQGFWRLRELAPDVEYVQFVDGDCELVPSWLDAAAAFLANHHDAAVACGRLREKYPARSIYNALCDIEWDTPIGPSMACGGIAMMRAYALEATGGFRADLIAGEEPELCVRLRAAGWSIWRLDAEMALHDAALTRFSEWWRRAMRTGYAFAQGAHLHGRTPERHRVRESLSAWLWAFLVPASILICALLVGPRGLAIFAIYPIQVVRLALAGRRTSRENWGHAVFLVIGKFPELLGQLKFFIHRRLGVQSQLIEYK